VSGLVYAVIVALWAAVLVPIWLRRHDDAALTRSADRYTRAMRTLSRKPPQVGSREVMMPPRPELAMASGVAVASMQSRAQVTTGSFASDPRPGPVATDPRSVPRRDVRSRPPNRRPGGAARAASARLARRRARTLLVLLALAIVLGLLAALGLVPWWSALPVVALLVGFVVHLRSQAKRAATARRGARLPSASSRREPTGAASRAVVVESKGHGTLGSAEPDQPTAAPEAAGGHARAADGAEVDDVGGFEPDTLEAELTDDDEAWRPQSWPLPTYVTKPKAMRPIRVIDLTTPGAWTSGRLLDDQAESTEDVLAAAEETTMELEAIVDRAAND
jgi:hypothetical protein